MMVVQYRGNGSLIFANKVRNITKAQIVFNTRKLKTFLTSSKSSFSLEPKSKVDYKISGCGCNTVYYCQACRYLRVDEHRKKDSPVGQYLRQCRNVVTSYEIIDQAT